MSNFPGSFGDSRSRPLDYAVGDDSQVLVRFFNQVYAWMATGLTLTGVVAWMVSNRPQWFGAIFSWPVLIGLFVVEIALVMMISSAINRINATVATGLFLLYSAINGITLSVIFLIYTKASLTSTFMVTAGTFAGMSIYGMVTKRDLTRLGSILFMALLGLVIASIVNIFLHSTFMYWLITYAGVLIFVGLTAYDTQMLKNVALSTANDARMASRLAISGALKLYLDFINLFLLLLRLMGNRR